MTTKSLIAINEPTSMITEHYKMFRTNLSYMNIDVERKVLLFTSSMAEEGKTTTICNTAISFATAGKKTLLIECDLRRARVHELFGLPQAPGLTNILSEKKLLSEMVRAVDEVEGLDVLTAGPLPPSPAELIGSQAFEQLILEARGVYDVILIDAPPILSVTDAAVISRVADGILLVVAAGETKKDAIKQAKKSIHKVGAEILGVVLTKVDLKRSGYYYAYDNYYSRDKKKKKRFFSFGRGKRAK